MPTVEERLAALETKLAALTETTPTTYYEHQYSGEEIDAAVGRALTGGALDTSVTNVSNQLGTFVRPNLLDNWYFGNPVDQRGGYIVPKGVNYYKVDGFVPQGPIPETVKVDYIDNAGSARFNYGGAPCYVPKDGGYVRGYTGSWLYGIDRWFLGGEPSNVMEITDEGIHVSYTQPGWNMIQKLKNVLCKGNTYTFSAVVKSTLPVRLVASWGDNRYFFNEGFPATSEWALVTITGTVPNNAEIAYEQVVFQPLGSVAGTMDIKAAKLELGPTQTLAHKEGERWVLNEVPNYGEQLRRCQRYALLSQGIMESVPMCQGFIFVPTPVTMRSKPVIVGAPSVLAFETNAQIPDATVSVHSIMPNGVLLSTTATVPAYVYFGAGSGLSADL